MALEVVTDASAQPAEAPRPRCESCVHFESLKGECRRNPPQIAMGERGQVVSVWPPTRGHLWCGEHKA